MERNPQIDILRAVAIAMVMYCHSVILRKPTWDIVLWRPCWSGVDLFFVISGFLIAGLLFSEYRETGTIRISRFYIRRGFKIYPAFYVMVVVTLVVFPGRYAHHQLFNDIFFLQSYREGRGAISGLCLSRSTFT